MAGDIPDLRCKIEDAFSPDGELVKVVVGPEERKFLVHETVLRSSSCFFQAALKKEWKSGEERNVSIPDEDAEVLSHYVYWLYAGRLPCRSNSNDRGYLPLAKLYGLGENLIDKTLQNRVLDGIIAASRQSNDKGGRVFPSKQTVYTIYQSTLERSPARKLMVDIHGLMVKITASATKRTRLAPNS